MSEQSESHLWGEVVGLIVVATLLVLIALNAIAGWTWTSQFLVSAGPAWVQAVGSVLAIYAAWRIAKTQSDERLKASHAAARIAVLRLYTPFVRLVSTFQAVNNRISDGFGVENKREMFKAAMAALHQVRPPADDQLALVGTLHPELARLYAAAVSHLESMIFLMDTISQRDPLTDEDLVEAVEQLKVIVPLVQRYLSLAEPEFRIAFQAASS